MALFLETFFALFSCCMGGLFNTHSKPQCQEILLAWCKVSRREQSVHCITRSKITGRFQWEEQKGHVKWCVYARLTKSMWGCESLLAPKPSRQWDIKIGAIFAAMEQYHSGVQFFHLWLQQIKVKHIYKQTQINVCICIYTHIYIHTKYIHTQRFRKLFLWAIKWNPSKDF